MALNHSVMNVQILLELLLEKKTAVVISILYRFFPSFLKDSFWKERFYVYDSMIPELSSSQLDQVIQK